jgi:hypothetical protein
LKPIEFGGEPQDISVTATGVADTAGLRVAETREVARLAIAHLGGSRFARLLFTSRDDAVAWLATMRA